MPDTCPFTGESTLPLNQDEERQPDGMAVQAIDNNAESLETAQPRNTILAKHLAEFITQPHANKDPNDLIANLYSELESYYTTPNAALRDFVITRGIRSAAMAALFYFANDYVMEARMRELHTTGQSLDTDASYDQNLDNLTATVNSDPNKAFVSLMEGWFTEAFAHMESQSMFNGLFTLFDTANSRHYDSIHNAIRQNNGVVPNFIPRRRSTPRALAPRTYQEELAIGLNDLVNAALDTLTIFQHAVRLPLERFAAESMEPTGQDQDTTLRIFKKFVADFIGDAAIASVPKLAPLATTDTPAMQGIFSSKDPIELDIPVSYSPDQGYVIEMSWQAPHLPKTGWPRPGFCGGIIETETSATGVRFIDTLSDFALATNEAQQFEPYKIRQDAAFSFLLLGALAARRTLFYEEPRSGTLNYIEGYGPRQAT